MKRNASISIMSIVSYLLSFVPLVVLAIFWRSMPAIVPVHIGFDGEVDRWGPKWELLIVGIVVAVLFVFTATVLRHSLRVNDQGSVYVSVKGHRRGVFSAFLTFIFLEIIIDIILIFFFETIHVNPVNIGRIISSGAGIVLVAIGNITPLPSTPSWFGLHLPRLCSRPKSESFVSRSVGFSALFLGITCVVLSFVLPLRFCGVMVVLCYISVLVLMIIFWLIAYWPYMMTRNRSDGSGGDVGRSIAEDSSDDAGHDRHDQRTDHRPPETVDGDTHVE